MARPHEDNEGPGAHAAHERMAHQNMHPAAKEPPAPPAGSIAGSAPPNQPAAVPQPQAGEIPAAEHALIGSVRDQVKQAREKLAELEKVLAGIGERLGIS